MMDTDNNHCLYIPLPISAEPRKDIRAIVPANHVET